MAQYGQASTKFQTMSLLMEYTLPCGSLLISDNTWLHENVVVVAIHYMEHVCT